MACSLWIGIGRPESIDRVDRVGGREGGRAREGGGGANVSGPPFLTLAKKRMRTEATSLLWTDGPAPTELTEGRGGRTRMGDGAAALNGHFWRENEG